MDMGFVFKSVAALGYADDCEIIGLTRRNPIKSRVLPC